MKTLASAAVALLLGAPVADKPFVTGGAVNIQLEAGSYRVVPSADNHIRIMFSGNVGSTVAEVTTAGTQATVRVKNTPNHGDFGATIEVPKTSDLVLHLSAGELSVGAITGNKDIDSNAGDVTIAVGKADDYASVDASVKVGDLSAGQFGGKKEGFIGQSLTWTGKGKYKLRARLLAGDLKLK